MTELQKQENPEISVILKDLQQYPVSSKTPLEAMNSIAKWQEALKVSQEADTHS